MVQAVNQKAHFVGLFAFIGSLLDLVFPPRCLHCGRLDTPLCPTCQQLLETRPLRAILRTVTNLQQCLCTTEHEGIIREAVHALKYENGRFVAPLLAERLAQQVRQHTWQLDILIPVPLSTHRLTERGYNQSSLLAEETGRLMGLTCLPNALQRHRHTRAQVGLTAAERYANVRQAFTADSSLIHQKHILLIDDVCTTGATLSACAESLLAAGAKVVYGLTVTTANDSSVHQ